jgi:hypothetical protein
MKGWDIERMWAGKATDQETQKAIDAADAFATRMPTFARTLHNAQVMAEFTKNRELDATSQGFAPSMPRCSFWRKPWAHSPPRSCSVGLSLPCHPLRNTCSSRHREDNN